MRQRDEVSSWREEGFLGSAIGTRADLVGAWIGQRSNLNHSGYAIVAKDAMTALGDDGEALSVMVARAYRTGLLQTL
jgi:hypothetical protein